MRASGEGSSGIPLRIDTERLTLRCWTEADAEQLREAIDGSLDHLRAWLPWAHAEPKSVEETRKLLRGFEEKFRAGEDFTFGIFSRDDASVIGGCGLHRRVGEGALEIGYWVRADQTRRGFATEAARALTRAGLEAFGIDRIRIHCDPRNVASRRVPERLGYTVVETRVDDVGVAAGEGAGTLGYEFPSSPMGPSGDDV